jgi:dUTP pyrophosphatase
MDNDKKEANMQLKVKRIVPQAKLPSYGHPGDAGMDLYAAVDRVLAPGELFAVPTGIKMAIPRGFVGLVWDKSGISLKGVHRLAGVVDAGYRGEVQIVLINLSGAPFEIKTGMKIAQMLIQPVGEAEVVEAEELDDTSRGEGGFGSTGLY